MISNNLAADFGVLADTVEHVVCRWCKAVDAVEVVARPGLVGPPS